LFATKENGSKKLVMVKKIFFKQNFLPLKQIFCKLFFLFLIAKSVKFKMHKEKIKILFLHGKNCGERLTGYTFRVGYTYRADCT
jgi:hypothetical protein